MAKIPQKLKDPINKAFPTNVLLVGTTQPDGYAQITPRGSVMVFDDEHFCMWERGKGSTTAHMQDGTKVTLFYRNSEFRGPGGLLPKGGIARFYGVASVHKSGAVYERSWDHLIPAEKERDPDKKGFAVLIKVERAEDLDGDPLPG